MLATGKQWTVLLMNSISSLSTLVTTKILPQISTELPAAYVLQFRQEM